MSILEEKGLEMRIFGDKVHESDFDEGQYVESNANMVYACKEELHECPNMKV